jgi:hypothetical protein
MNRDQSPHAEFSRWSPSLATGSPDQTGQWEVATSHPHMSTERVQKLRRRSMISWRRVVATLPGA